MTLIAWLKIILYMLFTLLRLHCVSKDAHLTVFCDLEKQQHFAVMF